jgi:aspartyl-tRNA synthetase
LHIEYVVAVEGTMCLHPKVVVNAGMATGLVEVVAERIKVLNQVRVALPFLVTTADDSKDVPTEEVGLRLLLILSIFSRCACCFLLHIR